MLKRIVRSGPATYGIAVLSVLGSELLVRPYVDMTNWTKYFFGFWIVATYWCATKGYATGLACSLTWWIAVRWILNPYTFQFQELLREPERCVIQIVGPVMVTRNREKVRRAERLRQEAEQQRFNMLRQLSAGFANEFNNLLMVIAGSAELFVQEEGSNRRAADIQAAAERAAASIRRFRECAREGVVPPELVRMAQEIEQIERKREEKP